MGERIVGVGAAGFGGGNAARFEIEEEINHSDEFSDSYDDDQHVDTDSNSGTELNKISLVTENKINTLMNLATSIRGGGSHNVAASSSTASSSKKKKKKKKTKQCTFYPLIQRAPQRIQRVPPLPPKMWWPSRLNPEFLFLGVINYVAFNVGHMKLKERLAALYIKDVSRVGEAYSHVLESIEELKSCYDESVMLQHRNNEKLAWMFLVDGCALLFLIDCLVFGEYHVFRKNNIPVHKVCSDVFLLENQLPYKLLMLLVRHRLGATTEPVIHAFVDTFSMSGDVVRRAGKEDHFELYGCPNHLLDLLWMKVGPVDQKCSGSLLTISATTETNIKGMYVSDPYTYNSQQCVRAGMIKCLPATTFYSIRKLKAAGIQMKPSKSKLLTDVSFSHGTFLSGKLELPRLVLDHCTRHTLSNMIAYEMCPDFQKRQHVTSYVCFINSLIANVEDVAELRSAGIIVDSTDANVLDLFRSLADEHILDPADYSGVREDIEIYLSRKIRTTIANCIASAAHKYSKISWTAVAVYSIVAFFMILSSIHTYFTVFPRKLGSS